MWDERILSKTKDYGLPMNQKSWPTKPLSLSFVLVSVLMAGLIFGCVRVPVNSAYRVQMPILDAKPERANCLFGGSELSCILLLEDDYKRIVRELKACCIATGGSDSDCLTGGP